MDDPTRRQRLRTLAADEIADAARVADQRHQADDTVPLGRPPGVPFDPGARQTVPVLVPAEIAEAARALTIARLAAAGVDVTRGHTEARALPAVGGFVLVVQTITTIDHDQAAALLEAAANPR